MITTAFLKNSRFALLALLALLVAVAIYWFHSVAMPFAVGAFLAYLLAPLIAALVTVRIRGRLVRRGVAILLVYALGIGLIALIGVYLVPKLTSEVNGLVRDLPRILKEIEREWVVPAERRVNGWLREFVPIATAENGGAGLQQPESGDKRSAPLAPQDRPNGGLEPLLENYTFLVREVEGGGLRDRTHQKGAEN
ncbi:MAG: AI-2E family transporter, partial [bacterium]